MKSYVLRHLHIDGGSLYPNKPGHAGGHVESVVESSQIHKGEGGGAFPKVLKSLTKAGDLASHTGMVRSQPKRKVV